MILVYRKFCSACTVTVVIFGHLNRSFYLPTYVQEWTMT